MPKPRKDEFAPVPAEQVPADLRWTTHRLTVRLHTEYNFGKTYKRSTDFTVTPHAVSYYKRIDAPDDTPLTGDRARAIDAEPEARKQLRYHTGKKCWFVDTDSRWYLCAVTKRFGKRIAIRPVTGQDSTNEKIWPYGGSAEGPSELEFSTAAGNSNLYARLRPLKDKQP